MERGHRWPGSEGSERDMAAVMVRHEYQMTTATHQVAARARALTTAQCHERALALAAHHHLTGRAIYIREDADGWQRFETPSKSEHDEIGRASCRERV